MEFLKEIWSFLRERKKFWLAPVIIILVLIGVLITINLKYVQSILENLLNTELFAEEIYYLSSLPSEIKYEEIILVFITSLLITIFSTIFPALRSAKIDPITSIRNE